MDFEFASYVFLIVSDYMYVKRISKAAVLLCQQGEKSAKPNFPQLMYNPGPLSSTVTLPVQNTAVERFVSRFN